MPWAAAIGAGAGAAGGLLASKKTAGTDAGNQLNLTDDQRNAANHNFDALMHYSGSDAAIDPIQSSRIATNEVQNNGILGQLFGKGGTMERTAGEEQGLANRGFSLQPEDYEAYGQGAGDIARQFGNSQSNLAQALASRGLSGSGVAGAAFAGSEGNKNEQLGHMQMQIAQQRMNMNLQRLGQTRNFLSQLGQQGENAIEGQFGRQMSSEKQNFGETEAKNAAGQSRLEASQNQANNQLAQRQGTQTQQPWAAALGGALQGGAQGGMGAMNAGAMGSSLGSALASSQNNGMQLTPRPGMMPDANYARS